MHESLVSGGSATSHGSSSSGNAVELPPGRWHALADAVLADQPITFEQASAVLAAPDDELLDLLSAAFRVRAILRPQGAALLPDECQERAVSGRLRLLFAVESFRG